MNARLTCDPRDEQRRLRHVVDAVSRSDVTAADCLNELSVAHEHSANDAVGAFERVKDLAPFARFRARLALVDAELALRRAAW
jgi:hypothetical protein